MSIDAKFLNKTLAVQIQQYIKRIIYHIKWDLAPGMLEFFIIYKSISRIHHTKKKKKKKINYMIISIHAENLLTKFNTHL